MTFFLLIAFLAGVLTVISPCVLPLLPVIVGGSLAGGRSVRRALTVTLSLGVSVFAFTFLLKVSTAFINVPQSAWDWLSGGILFFVGIFFLFPRLWDLVPGAAKANRDSSTLMSGGFMRQSVLGDVIVGAALGPVFTTCSPTYFIVLASVLPVSLATGVADILAYILGLCLFLFVIALAGQRLLEKLNVAADPNGWFRKALGVLFILIAVLIVTNTLAAVEAPLYNVFDETKIEQRLLPTDSAPAAATSTPHTGSASGANKSGPPAPALIGIAGYINTGGEPITLAQYQQAGKVVLVDFWDYSCINCERTLPYLNAWYAKYKADGFVIVGVHTPEFAFEHLLSNVQQAVTKFGIQYPVVLDNNYDTWNAYQNEYWPAEYLIGKNGDIVYTHFGEGDYAQDEEAIQQALGIATSTVDIAPDDLSAVESPETYFGSNRNEYLGNGTQGVAGVEQFVLPATPAPNTLYLGGSWDIEPEYAEGGAGAKVLYQYDAHDIYMVAAPASASTTISITLDGKIYGDVTITQDTLYPLVEMPSAGVHTIEIEVESGTLDTYTFTFG